MMPQPIGDVRCSICLDEVENDTHASAGDQLVDHLTDEHDHFTVDAVDTCPLCGAAFQGGESGTEGLDAVGQQRERRHAIKEKLIDHLSTDHAAVYSRAVREGLAGGR